MNDDIGFKLIRPLDFADLDRLAKHMSAPRIAEWYWEDSQRVNPLLSFASVFMHPDNIVIDVGPGAGVAAFANIQKGWRASLHVAMWGKKAFRQPALWKKIASVVMEMKDLITIEAITRKDNILANRALKACGFRHRGSIPDRLCYNGVRMPGEWWELERSALGIPERTIR